MAVYHNVYRLDIFPFTYILFGDGLRSVVYWMAILPAGDNLCYERNSRQVFQ